MPGAALGILRDGVATTAYYGVEDVNTGEPVTAQMRFGVGSLAKSMVATVIAGGTTPRKHSASLRTGFAASDRRAPF